MQTSFLTYFEYCFSSQNNLLSRLTLSLEIKLVSCTTQCSKLIITEVACCSSVQQYFMLMHPRGSAEERGPPSCCRRHKASHLWLCSVIQPQPLAQHTASLRSKATSEAAPKTKGGRGLGGSRWSVGFRAQASGPPCLYSVLPAWLINGVEGEIYSSPANIREHIYQNSATAWLHLLNVWSPT